MSEPVTRQSEYDFDGLVPLPPSVVDTRAMMNGTGKRRTEYAIERAAAGGLPLLLRRFRLEGKLR